MSALGVVEAGGPKDGDLLELLVDRIREPDPHWRILVTAQVLKPTLDRILEGLGDSATVLSRFSTLYQQLEPARRRGEYGRTYTKSDGDLSSLLCLLIVLGLLDEPTVPAPQRHETLDRAIGWSVRMLLTSAPANEPTISVERVFAAALRLAARFASPRLNAALAVTATDPTLSAWVIALLARELPRGDLDNLLRPVGLTVESVVERARWFALLTGRTADKAAVAAVEQAFAQPLSLSPTNG